MRLSSADPPFSLGFGSWSKPPPDVALSLLFVSLFFLLVRVAPKLRCSPLPPVCLLVLSACACSPEVTVTSSSPTPFVSPRGLFDKNQRFFVSLSSRSKHHPCQSLSVSFIFLLSSSACARSSVSLSSFSLSGRFQHPICVAPRYLSYKPMFSLTNVLSPTRRYSN